MIAGRGDDGLARGDGRGCGDSGRRGAHHEDAGGERREGTEPPSGRAAEACAERAQSAAEPEASHGLLEQTIGQRRRDSRDEGRCDADGNRHRGIREASDGRLPEVVEYRDHPWFIGVQSHPELKSKPFEPAPLFAGFVHAAMENERLV